MDKVKDILMFSEHEYFYKTLLYCMYGYFNLLVYFLQNDNEIRFIYKVTIQFVLFKSNCHIS